MGGGKSAGKTIVLLFLILILVLGGLLWFDYLGVIHVKPLFAPFYRLIGREPQTSTTATYSKPLTADIDQNRLDKQRESLDLFKEELDKRDSDLQSAEKKNQQVAQDLADKQKAEEEREKTFNNEVKKYNDREVNISQISKNLEGMPPKNAVDILVAMDDQMVIDVLRKVEEEAQAAGTSSMVAYWLSLMPADRAAQIQRKMTSKPETASN